MGVRLRRWVVVPDRRRHGEADRAAGGAYTFDDIDFSQFFGERFGGAGGTGFEDLFGQFAQVPREVEGGRPLHDDAVRTFVMKSPCRLRPPCREEKFRLPCAHPAGPPETLAVKIPPGIEEGKKIRLRGKGEPGARGGPQGDLLLTVRVAPHPFFQRKGQQLHVTVPVTLSEAALGAKVDVPTPKGTVSLKVPGTSGGSKLRVKAHGVPSKDGTTGDLIAEIQIVLPKQIDEETRRVLERLRQQPAENPRAKLQW